MIELRQHEHGVSDWSECSSSLDGEKARKTPGHTVWVGTFCIVGMHTCIRGSVSLQTAPVSSRPSSVLLLFAGTLPFV